MTPPGVDWKTYVDMRIEALDIADRDRAAASRLAIDAALSAAEKAVLKAETAQSAKNDSLNELRGMVADWRTIFALKDSVEVRFGALEKTMSELKEDRSKRAGTGQTFAILGSAIVAVAAIGSIIAVAMAMMA